MNDPLVAAVIQTFREVGVTPPEMARYCPAMAPSLRVAAEIVHQEIQEGDRQFLRSAGIEP